VACRVSCRVRRRRGKPRLYFTYLGASPFRLSLIHISFKAPELPKKEKKVKPAPEGGEEVKTSNRPGKKAKKHVAHAHGKKAAPKRAAKKKKKK